MYKLLGAVFTGDLDLNRVGDGDKLFFSISIISLESMVQVMCLFRSIKILVRGLIDNFGVER